MTNIEIVTLFEAELSNILDEAVRATTVSLLTAAPAYFYKCAASSSGKYHPQYALGEGGLVRHVKAAVRFATHLFVITSFTQREKDAVIAALLLHDVCKHGMADNAETTVHEHPLLAAQYIRSAAPHDFAEMVAPLVETHMGQWTTSKYSNVVLNAPETDLQKFVHQCDFLASRKDIEVLF